MPRIPEPLMIRLRLATESFHQVRVLGDDIHQMDAAERSELARALRAAEAEFDDVTEAIDEFLSTAPGNGAHRSRDA